MAGSPALCLGPHSHPPCPLLSLVGLQNLSLAKIRAELRDKPVGAAQELLSRVSGVTLLTTPEYLGRGYGEYQGHKGSWK